MNHPTDRPPIDQAELMLTLDQILRCCEHADYVMNFITQYCKKYPNLNIGSDLAGTLLKLPSYDIQEIAIAAHVLRKNLTQGGAL